MNSILFTPKIPAGMQSEPTQGEIEAAVCNGMSRFQLDCMGRGPKDISSNLIGNMLVVRMFGVLTAAEQQLTKSQLPTKGRDLLKAVRTELMEQARPALDAMIYGITGVRPTSFHHDISTVTGDEIVVFILSLSPQVRECKSKRGSV